MNMAPVDSVWPYPSIRGAHMQTLRKFWTSGKRGALPEIMILTLPPSASLVFAKKILS
jgi:hypothetical protein